MKIFTKYNLSILFLLSLLLIQQSIMIDMDNRLRNHQNDTFELGRVTGCANPNDTIRYTVTTSASPPNQRIEYYENRCGDTYRIIDGEIIQQTFYVYGEGYINETE